MRNTDNSYYLFFNIYKKLFYRNMKKSNRNMKIRNFRFFTIKKQKYLKKILK